MCIEHEKTIEKREKNEQGPQADGDGADFGDCGADDDSSVPASAARADKRQAQTNTEAQEAAKENRQYFC